MFGKKTIKDMADINVYTAGKLKDMAGSLEGLAKAFSDEIRSDGRLNKEDAKAALQTAAAVVCGNCSNCNICSDSNNEENYYLYYLLRAFEQSGQVEFSDMPQMFRERCRRREAFMQQMNSCLGKATMNLAWKNRFMESRDAIVSQFRELAVILEEFSGQMEQAVDITSIRENAIRKEFAFHHIKIRRMLMIEYGNKKREAFLTLRTTNGRCITTREAADIMGKAMSGSVWTPAYDGRSIVTRQFTTIRLLEEGKYHMMYGIARVKEDESRKSGDNYTFSQSTPGQMIMSLSDGMGSGETAEKESRQVIELTEQLIGTGFSQRGALKLVNTVLLLTSGEQHPVTMDLGCVDLYTGVLEIMKLGAAATFVMNDEGVDAMQAGEVPAGIINPVEPILISKKLWDNDRIIMVTDGVLDALPGEDKERVLKEYLESMPRKTPQDMANRILNFARSFQDFVEDDMTVLVAGIWKRN